jgi:hypothetical protein
LGDGDGRYELFVGCGVGGGGKLTEGGGGDAGYWMADVPPLQPAAMTLAQKSAKNTSAFRDDVLIEARAFASAEEILAKGRGTRQRTRTA